MVPVKLENGIKLKFGEVFINDIEELKKDKNKFGLYQKLLSEWMFIYLTINHPLRLDYYNLPILDQEDKKNEYNYIVLNDSGFIFYLNKYKTIKTYGKQVLEYNDLNIKNYINELELILGEKPKYLYLWYYKDKLHLFNKLVSYSHNISNIMQRVTGFRVNNNMIRKIIITSMINDDNYKNLTNTERAEAHKKMLHSTSTANTFYKKIKVDNSTESVESTE